MGGHCKQRVGHDIATKCKGKIAVTEKTVEQLEKLVNR